MDVVIKVDVEGYEKIVIEQLMQVNFLHNIKTVYYEYDENIQNDMNVIGKLLKQNNFSKFLEVKNKEVKNLFNMLSERG